MKTIAIWVRSNNLPEFSHMVLQMLSPSTWSFGGSSHLSYFVSTVQASHCYLAASLRCPWRLERSHAWRRRWSLGVQRGVLRRSCRRCPAKASSSVPTWVAESQWRHQKVSEMCRFSRESWMPGMFLVLKEINLISSNARIWQECSFIAIQRSAQILINSSVMPQALRKFFGVPLHDRFSRFTPW